ncbi:cytochrome P450, putative [Pediculus humanus corporis]|uniref:Cytochrome P450, putative n=1 Tax=Pediculus humanus subsp. corporis TaxID=121224 RepID=E0VCJ5_PEDHC|nr:cytochrome P450, putative [Pediculus humanus corporis]EEB11101.1 cytochrome P450, putative [Pediculus humanus corporis]
MDDTVSQIDFLSATSIFYFLAGIVVLLYIAEKIQSLSRQFKISKSIPGPPGLPYIGVVHFGLIQPEGLVKFAFELGEAYGSVVKGVLGGKLYIFLSDPRDIEIILSSHTYIDKSPEYKFFKPWLGDGLLISTGDKWRSHRKLIAPTFHHNVLKSFIGLFNKNSKTIINKMEKEIGKTFDVHDYMSTVTVDILIETAMGINKSHQDNAGYDYAMAVMKMCDIIHQRMYKIWLRFEWLFQHTSNGVKQKKFLNTIHSLTSRVIKEKKLAFAQNKSILSSDIFKMNDEEEAIKSTLEKESKTPFLKDDLDDDGDVGEKKRKAFLDLMLQLQRESKLTDEEIKEEVDTIMFEGHDTTAAASSFFLSILGLYPDIQEKVYKEQYEIFGDSNRPVTFTDTVNMKYLERVIMETLRLYPPVPTIARQVFEDIKLGRKYAMLKLKILLSNVIRAYRIYSDIPEKDYCLTADIILKRKEGFQVRIEKRQPLVK